MTTIPQPKDLAKGFTATWDAWNRLVKLADTSGTVSEYSYDGLNRRITKTVDSTVRHFYFSDQWQVLEERVDIATTADKQYVWGERYIDDLVLRDKGSERLYALQDALFNVVAIAEETGSVQERFAYQPYGESESLNPDFTSYTGSDYNWEYRFTGRRLDLETGLQLNRNRFYHAPLGRWLSRDPIGFDGGWNLYAAYFVPNGVDPTGFKCKVCSTWDSGYPSTGNHSLTGMDAGVVGTPFTNIMKGWIDDMRQTYKDKFFKQGDIPYVTKTGPYRFTNSKGSVQGIEIPEKLFEVDARLTFIVFLVCEDNPGDCEGEVQEKWLQESYDELNKKWKTERNDQQWRTMLGPRAPDPAPPTKSNMIITDRDPSMIGGHSDCPKAVIIGDFSNILSTLGGNVGGQPIPRDLRNLTIQQRARVSDLGANGPWSRVYEWSIGTKGRENG